MKKNIHVTTMKKLATIAMVSMMMATSVVPAYASPLTAEEAADAIIEASGGKFALSDDLEYYGGVAMENTNTGWDVSLTDVFNKAFRACDIREITLHSYGCGLKGQGLGYSVIDVDNLGLLAEHQGAVEDWAYAAAREHITDGMTVDEAVKAAYLYIAENYKYADSISHEDLVQAQGAYYMITNGEAVCASYTRAFRTLVEAVPFADGVVDWEVGTKGAVKVAILQNSKHMWNAIQDTDGNWYYYDLSVDNTENLGSYKMDKATMDAHSRMYENPEWLY